MAGWIVATASIAYLCLLFAIAYYGDRRADLGRSLIRNPAFYALSIAVYCTSWTFYGSVGRAAGSGADFLPIYLGPTLVFLLGWFMLRKMIRISKANRITTIADFIGARYGKSQLLAGLVTVIAVVGILPYISLQLKAVSESFRVLLAYPAVSSPAQIGPLPLLLDEALLVALLMGVFSILFGTRHIDASEHHQGMVAAIAFESVVKLLAFLAVGVFVTFGVFGGFADLFVKAAANPDLARRFTVGGETATSWVMLTMLAMTAIICLPRQFQVTVVENLKEGDLKKAIWLFPAYLIAINIFVLPIALAGLLHFPSGAVSPDTFVLALPIAEQQPWLALFVFLGGLSAATGMVIVETIALSTMVCNDLVMPVLLRLRWLKLTERGDLTRLLLGIRRGAIIAVVLLGYLYFRVIGESYTLVTIGLVSFVAAAQFAPAMIGGMFWKGGTRIGALAGLSTGFGIWAYTLLFPSLARSGWMPAGFIEEGLFGLTFLKPYSLFGLTGFDQIGHATFWSLLLNLGVYVGVSMMTRQDAIERIQAAQFVDVFRQGGAGRDTALWRGTATLSELSDLVARFVGTERTQQAFRDYARARNIDLERVRDADADLVSFAERVLAGAIGAASARVMVASVTKGEMVGIEEVMRILDETSQILQYSRQLELKSQQLEAATRELREANLRLQELDRLKDEFLSTISHELRTPLTSIRSFSEIVLDNPELSAEQRSNFLGIITREAERLTRLINQLLDLAKLEVGRLEWQMADFDPGPVVQDAIAATQGFVVERKIELVTEIPKDLPFVRADKDRLTQVVINLLSNAVKFSDATKGKIWVRARAGADFLEVAVRDNGGGIPLDWQDRIFEKFIQVRKRDDNKPEGTGLGLPICRQIIEFFGGKIWVESRPGHGATFTFTVPLSRAITRRLVAAA
jgi:hypothetical protein